MRGNTCNLENAHLGILINIAESGSIPRSHSSEESCHIIENKNGLNIARHIKDGPALALRLAPFSPL
jgi:hypothetical protein